MREKKEIKPAEPGWKCWIPVDEDNTDIIHCDKPAILEVGYEHFCREHAFELVQELKRKRKILAKRIRKIQWVIGEKE